MEYRLLFLSFCLFMSAILMRTKVLSNKPEVVSSELSSLETNVKAVDNNYIKEVQPKPAALLNTTITPSEQESEADVSIVDNSQTETPSLDEIQFTEKMDELIAQQNSTDDEANQKQLEDLVYKYSSNEQREQLQNAINQIEN